MIAPMPAELDLFPRPRRIEPIGPGAPTAVPVRTVRDPSLPEQGYELVATPDAVTITHADAAGLRYGEATLAQLRTEGGDVPGVHVVDAPDFAVRGYMLDVSRDRVPDVCDVGTVGRVVRARAHQPPRALHRAHVRVPRPRGRVARRVADHRRRRALARRPRARSSGISLVANQNCFGHMGRWLRHQPYRAWAECPDGFEPIPGYRMEPTVLAPTEANAVFAQSLFAELLPNFRSSRVNIGCDETFDLGHGVSRDAVARVGKERVYIDHLRRIVEPLASDGHAVHYWADIVRKDPAFAAELPPTATPVCWTYEAPGPGVRLPDALVPVLEQLGVDLPDVWGFDENTAAARRRRGAVLGRARHIIVGLARGADRQRAGQPRSMPPRSARARGAPGYLITDWGDNGHLQPPSVSFGPLVYGGAVAWCRERERGRRRRVGPRSVRLRRSRPTASAPPSSRSGASGTGPASSRRTAARCRPRCSRRR